KLVIPEVVDTTVSLALDGVVILGGPAIPSGKNGVLFLPVTLVAVTERPPGPTAASRRRDAPRLSPGIPLRVACDETQEGTLFAHVASARGAIFAALLFAFPLRSLAEGAGDPVPSESESGFLFGDTASAPRRTPGWMDGRGFGG